MVSPIEDYQTIIQTLDHGNLLAVTEDGHFKEIGWSGRLWRGIKGLFNGENYFEDCKFPTIVSKIEEFAQKNQRVLSDEQRYQLFSKLMVIQEKFTNDSFIKKSSKNKDESLGIAAKNNISIHLQDQINNIISINSKNRRHTI